MRLFICLNLSLLTGCVPFVTFVDYRPQMQGGVIIADNCLGYERAVYQLDGVTITSSINQHQLQRKQNSSYPFSLSYNARLNIHTDAHARFLSSDVVIEKLPAGAGISTRASPNAIQTAQTGVIATFDAAAFGAPRGSLDSLATMVGQTSERNGVKFARGFSISVVMDASPEHDYRVTLPAMNINGNAVTIPPILFSRANRTKLIAPLNC